MAETRNTCRACGQSLDANARFCPQCGAMQAEEKAKEKVAHTIMGLSAADVAKATAQEQATKESSSKAFAKTMIGQGLSSPSAPPPQSPAASPPLSSKEPSAPSPPPAAAETGGIKQAEQARGRTMLGVPDPGGLAAMVQQAAAQAKRGGTEVDSTDMQLAATQAKRGGTEVDSTDMQQAAAQAKRGGTEVDSQDLQQAAAQAGLKLMMPDSVAPAPRKSRGIWWLVLVLLLAAAVAGVFLTQEHTTEGVVVTVENGQQGEEMLFRLQDAAPDTQVEFGGQTRAVENGVARFPLSNDSLVIGENLVLATRILADGTRDEIRVPLHVDYRVRIDTAPLADDDPAVDVVVQAAPGAKVQLDGQDLALDAQGKGTRHDTIAPIEAGSAATHEHRVNYQIDLSQGKPAQGELRVVLPIASLQIDSPTQLAIVDSETIALSGAVNPGATLVVDGETIDVLEGGAFKHTLPLPKVGRYTPKLMTKAAGHVPATATLDITRVNDIAKAALTFVPDKKLSYAEVLLAAHEASGQRVDFTGRVFNVNAEENRGVLQMLVRDCEKGKQCSLWVTYGATQPVQRDSTIRILGTLEGEQQFRSQSDAVVTVPKIHALFVLPAK